VGGALFTVGALHHVYVDREHVPDLGPFIRFEFPAIGHIRAPEAMRVLQQKEREDWNQHEPSPEANWLLGKPDERCDQIGEKCRQRQQRPNAFQSVEHPDSGGDSDGDQDGLDGDAGMRWRRDAIWFRRSRHLVSRKLRRRASIDDAHPVLSFLQA
jgi:hypothetical protein